MFRFRISRENKRINNTCLTKHRDYNTSNNEKEIAGFELIYVNRNAFFWRIWYRLISICLVKRLDSIELTKNLASTEHNGIDELFNKIKRQMCTSLRKFANFIKLQPYSRPNEANIDINYLKRIWEILRNFYLNWDKIQVKSK